MFGAGRANLDKPFPVWKTVEAFQRPWNAVALLITAFLVCGIGIIMVLADSTSVAFVLLLGPLLTPIPVGVLHNRRLRQSS